VARGGRFTRARATRAPKARFVIYCEGANTEPRYFRALAALYGNNPLVKPEPVLGDPLRLAEAAIEHAGNRRRRNSFEENDQVWAVFDRDLHTNFDGAIKLCEQHDVPVGRSNPCFELWLILHDQEFDRQHESRDVCRHLQTLNPGYDPDGSKECSWDRLGDRVLDAERRARRQLALREQEGDPHGRPSTTVGTLTGEIRMASERARDPRFP